MLGMKRGILAGLLTVAYLGGCVVEEPLVRPPPDEEPKQDPKRPRDPHDPKQPKNPKKPQVPEIADTVIERRDCGPSENAPTFRRVAEVEHRRVSVGECGELVWQGDEGSLFMTGIDGEPRKVSEKGWDLWAEGDRLLYEDATGVKFVDRGTVVQTWSVDGVDGGGALPGTESFWVCSERGIERLDIEGGVLLTDDMATDAYGSLCHTIAVSRQGTVAYPREEGDIGFVDVRTGEVRSFAQEFLVYYQKDEEDRSRLDEVRFSPDGSLLFHEKRWEELDYDALVNVSEGLVSAIEVATGKSNQIPGLLADGSVFGYSGLFWEWFGPWMGTAPGVYFPWFHTEGHLLGLGEPIVLEPMKPRSIRGSHVFLESSAGVALLDLETGDVHHILDVPSVETVVPFRWGGPVAISHLTMQCIRHLEPPSHCHTEIWGLASWEPNREAIPLALAIQPIQVRAVGPDGSMIVGGRFLPEEPPEFDEQREWDYRLFLMGPDGRRIRELDSGTGIEGGIGGEHFALIERERRDGGVRTEELVAIDWSTGEEELLVRGRFIDGLHLDHADRRVTVLVSPLAEGSPRELWSGVVGR